MSKSQMIVAAQCAECAICIRILEVSLKIEQNESSPRLHHNCVLTECMTNLYGKYACLHAGTIDELRTDLDQRPAHADVDCHFLHALA